MNTNKQIIIIQTYTTSVANKRKILLDMGYHMITDSIIRRTSKNYYLDCFIKITRYNDPKKKDSFRVLIHRPEFNIHSYKYTMYMEFNKFIESERYRKLKMIREKLC
jgi:CRISPR/Cas system type I-B associated protein Csh2 (Cas7 group RAMP superfamily)